MDTFHFYLYINKIVLSDKTNFFFFFFIHRDEKKKPSNDVEHLSQNKTLHFIFLKNSLKSSKRYVRIFLIEVRLEFFLLDFLFVMFFRQSLFSSIFRRKNFFRATHSLYPLTIRQIYEEKPLNQSVELIGYLLKVRKLKTHFFLDLFDGSVTNNQKHLQVVASLNDHPDLPRLTQGCSINVRGKLVESSHPQQKYEFVAEKIDLINACDTTKYPISSRVEQTLVQLRPDEHMRLRSPLSQVVFRLRSELMFCLYEYFHRNQFVHIQTPCLTQNDCEGGGETFRIQAYQSKTTEQEKEYFNRQVYLTVSGQLHLETAAK